MKKKYAFAGASGRGYSMYVRPLHNDFKDEAELVGIYDPNPIRASITSKEFGNIPVFDDFDKMIEEGKPDAVIITTVDSYHHEYIVRSLEAGCDAIVEKPLTIDAEKCNAIIDAKKATDRDIIVTFNCRYMPYFAKLKEIIKSGAIGEILNVDFEWMLDRRHGADYFRRWHRYLDKSGGLLIHKASHHFDIINWLVDQDPVKVYAIGDLKFYGPTRQDRGERCFTCSHKDSCEFYFDIEANEFIRKFYFEAEEADGYFRDRCIFSETIDIYDTMSVNVAYSEGTQLTYSLVAYSPYEGWRASFTGTEGRLEAVNYSSGQDSDREIDQIKIIKSPGETITYDVSRVKGGHGGGDEKLRDMVFRGGIPDPLGQKADLKAGIMSSIIGIAANESIKTGEPVNVADIIPVEELDNL